MHGLPPPHTYTLRCYGQPSAIRARFRGENTLNIQSRNNGTTPPLSSQPIKYSRTHPARREYTLYYYQRWFRSIRGGWCLLVRGRCKDLCLIATVWADDGGDIVVGNSQSNGKFAFVIKSKQFVCHCQHYGYF